MLKAAHATRGMVAAPHHLAAQAGLAILREGGNAIEAMAAAAAAIAVVYPHMNSLGGDNFWLISEKGQPPLGIDAGGAAAGLASRDFYREQGCAENIPTRGPLAALTVAGAVSGLQAALAISERWGGRLPLSRLFADAIAYARDGAPVSASQSRLSAEKLGELESVPHFAETFLDNRAPPQIGAIRRNRALADALERLAEAGLDDFYRGDLARRLASELEAAGSPLRLDDFERHRAHRVTPLRVDLRHGQVYGMPPPTQGLASLMILGLFERLKCKRADCPEYLHGLVEATKRAFIVRDGHVTDPAYMNCDAQAFLAPNVLDRLAAEIDAAKAMPWPHLADAGDTVWLGAIDGEGRAVSFIQSTYWEFGSGLVLPSTGIVWQNRGASFSLDPSSVNALLPYRRPFHTIQPAMALLKDGRVMAYGAMGGDGQPQTQACLYTRHVLFGQDLQQAITGPRWLLGRTWGRTITNLRVENRFARGLAGKLRALGHDIETIGDFDDAMGHAGALVWHGAGERAGLIEGAADPRSDGVAAGF
jgi:gamma-glutamyltranspeptidase/glutathione hydrolase